MRLFCLALAFVAVTQPAFARKASRHHVRVAPTVVMMSPTYAPEAQVAPQPMFARPYARHAYARRMRAEVPGAVYAPGVGPGASSFPGWSPMAPQGQDGQGAVAAMASRHAQANGIPESLVHRVIMRESRYNPRAVSRGNYGLMQIRLQTARSMGYGGSAAGLLDPETNLTYAVRYLAGAYRAAGGNANRSVSYYAGGYAHARRRDPTPYAMVQPASGFAPWSAPDTRHQMF
jgi:soluble lytic murein transglycosylase-like protein